jgi:HEAT repeat protein
MSEPGLREQAVAALASIREPKAVPELQKILQSSNDLEWNRAAIRALGKLGERGLSARFLELARDLRNPLVVPALIALADLKETQVLGAVREGFSSRSDEVAAASARAAGKLLALPKVEADDIRDRLASLLSDSDAAQSARSAALDSLVALNDPRLDHALAAAVTDAGLERTELMARIEQTIKERKKPLAIRS